VSNRRREALRGLAMVLAPVAVLALFIGFPVVLAVDFSLGHLGGPNAAVSSIALHKFSAHGHLATFAAYRSVLESPTFVRNLVATIWVTAATVVVVLALALAVGLYARLSSGWVAKAASALSVVPLFIPVVIASYSILTFWGPGGLVKTIAYHLGAKAFPTLGYSLGGVLVGEVWVNLPFGVLMIASGLQGVPDSVIEAARDAGASFPRIVRQIVLPLVALPMVIVATFTAIYVLGSFTVPYLVGPTSPNLLGDIMAVTFQAFDEPQQAVVMAVVVFLIAAGVGAIYVRASIRANRRSGVV